MIVGFALSLFSGSMLDVSGANREPEVSDQRSIKQRGFGIRCKISTRLHAVE